MENGRLSKFSTQNIFTQLMKYGSHILFAMSAIVLSYLSFVQNLSISPNVRNVSTIALVAMVLNYLVWNAYYQHNYNKVLVTDMENSDYSIHKRYWLARKGWKYENLQGKIRSYNKLFVTTWVQDICEQLGLTEKQISELYVRRQLTVARDIEGLNIPEKQIIKYRKYSWSYKRLIARIANKVYPESGIKTPRDVLYVLSVGKSSKMKINIREAELYYRVNAFKKIVMLICGTILAVSLVYEFADGNWKSTLLKLVINLVLLFSSFFAGSMTGVKGGQIKLAIAEEISEMLEEWKDEIATEVPFKPEPIVETKEIVAEVIKTEIVEEPKETITVENKPQPEKVTIEIT